MAEFQSIINGLPNIFDEGTDIFDVQKHKHKFKPETYVKVSEGVHCRIVENNEDIRDAREETARDILAALLPVSESITIMFCQFDYEATMRLHAHPQKQICYVIDGTISFNDGKTYHKGESVQTLAMVKHAPFSKTGCFLLVIWFGYN